MIRQTVRSIGLAAAGLLLASVAWGQPVLTQTSIDAQYLAAEYFGDQGARVFQASKVTDVVATATITERRPYVQLLLTGTPVTDGNTADITFRLSGATFSQTASAVDLDHRSPNCEAAAPVPGGIVEGTVMGGGNPGDDYVTYRVEVTDTGADPFAVDTAICFWLPDLAVTPGPLSKEEGQEEGQGVTVKAESIKPIASTGTPFPRQICGAPTTMPANPCPTPSGSEVNVFETKPALTASLGTGGTAYVVDLANRLTIGRGGTPDPSATGVGAAMGLLVGRLTVGVSQEHIWELDGGGYLPKDAVDGSLSGQIKLTVGGTFQSGDKLVVGSGPTALMGEIDAEGKVAEVSLQIERIGGMPIVYVPGGVDVLKPTTFSAAGAYLFNDSRNRHGPFGMSHGELKYFGIDVEGYAYGVVRGSGTDRSFVRVTCETATPCAIFADCTSQNGEGEYFEAAPPIPGGATMAWSSDDIGDLMGDHDWVGTPGRGRCDVYSNGELSVQHMVRSGGILVNSSAVVGRSLDLRADRARATIDMVVDNICASVEGHLGREGDADGADDNLATLNDNISAIAATPCRSMWTSNVDTNGVDQRGVPNNVDTNGDPSSDNTNPNGF